jgi:muramoyltetrapeptide carboxypeptidase
MKPIRPPKLNKGDLIGLLSPASAVADATKIEKAVQYFESQGYSVALGTNVGKVHGYLAGTDEERVADLHAMFRDKRVKAIIALRGGYGTPRFLSLLNYKLIARNPKILCGYSDLTSLQLALWKKSRLITFHGPMAAVDFANEIDSFTEEMFWRVVTSTKKLGKVVFPREPSVHSLLKGTSRGRLLGGNLSLVVSVLGTKYAPDFKNSLLFLEEIGEEPYRIDRMMVHLRNASVFSEASGILFGQFTDCKPIDPSKPSLTTEYVLREVATHMHIPILSNLPFGHVPQKLTLPLGLLARLNANRRTVEFLEAAVQ